MAYLDVIRVNGEAIPSVETVCTDRRPGYGRAAQWYEPTPAPVLKGRKPSAGEVATELVPFAVEAGVQFGVLGLFFLNPVVGILAMVGMSGRSRR